MSKPYYLAGPMTGIPKFNFPAFVTAAVWLRQIGYEIISPAEQDSPTVQAAAFASQDGALLEGMIGGESYGEILARDVRIVMDKAGGIILLPSWQNSRGARIETFVAMVCGHPIFEYVVAAHPVQRTHGWAKERLL